MSRQPYIRMDIPPIGKGEAPATTSHSDITYRHLSRGIYVPVDATPDEIGKAFDEWHRTGYDSTAIWSRPTTEMVLRVCGVPTGNVYDLGAGSGISAEAMVDAGVAPEQITGIDISRGMLEAAAANPKLAKATLVHGDITERLDEMDKNTDPELAISIFALSNLPPEQWDRTLTLTGEHLAPNGILAVAEGTNDLSQGLIARMVERGAFNHQFTFGMPDKRQVPLQVAFIDRNHLLQ